ncbi:MAG TPA: carotenoid biosynthesis protein [Novosphingobium sp.]|nr:carotenoid biosynthesis protein [Novosphingobium sp.]
MNEAQTGSDGGARLRICWGMGIAWLAGFFGSLLLGGTPALVAGVVQVVMLIAIVVVHSSILYGWTGTLIYLVLGSAIGFGLEASSVANGFPFGTFVHHEPGPKPLGVSIQAILVYVLAGWYAWVIARAAVLTLPWRLAGANRFFVPLVAALVLAGLDFPHDAIGATVNKMWTYAYPSGQFGVPLTNFLGWIFTGWVLFQLFALIGHRFPSTAASANPRYWLIPCLIWAVMPIQFLISWRDAPEGTVSLGQSVFVIADIHEAAVIGSLFSMLLPALIGIFRMLQPDATGRLSEKGN